MKFSNIFLAVLGCFLWTAAAWAQNTIPYRFATRAEAQMLITDIDEYTNSLNQFDVEVRLQKKDGRKSQFLTLAMNETQNWSDQDREKVNKAMKAISDQIQKQKFTLHFPKEIILLKTSMKEEGNRSGYARKNWIALGENLLSGASEDSLQQKLDNAKQKTEKYITEHLSVAERCGKPMVIEEFGYPRDGFKFEKHAPTVARDSYYESVFGLINKHARTGGLLAGCNFWAWGGSASLPTGHDYWKPGDDYTGDPAQEAQGLNSVFSTDSTTLSLIQNINAILSCSDESY